MQADQASRIGATAETGISAEDDLFLAELAFGLIDRAERHHGWRRVRGDPNLALRLNRWQRLAAACRTQVPAQAEPLG